MAARRPIRRPAHSRRPASRRGRTAKGSGTALVVGGLVAALLVTLVLLIPGRGGSRVRKPVVEPTRAGPKEPEPSKAAPLPRTKEQTGRKQPDRPAPRVSASALAACEKLYQEAKKACNRAVAEQRKDRPSKPLFRSQLLLTKQKVREVHAKIQEVLDWQEEAEWKDWIIPGHVDRVIELYRKCNLLNTKAHKLAPGL